MCAGSPAHSYSSNRPIAMAASHVDVLERVKEAVGKLLNDPFLLDLPRDVTPDEVTSCLAVAEGRALTVHLRTYDDQIIPIVVLQGATVADLMKGVEREVSRRCKREGMEVSISWKYVWSTYWLAYGQCRLENRGARLTSYGLGNHSEVNLVKRLRPKHRQKMGRTVNT